MWDKFFKRFSGCIFRTILNGIYLFLHKYNRKFSTLFISFSEFNYFNPVINYNFLMTRSLFFARERRPVLLGALKFFYFFAIIK